MDRRPMNPKPPQNVDQELEYQARQAALNQVTATPAATIQRYREHKRWRSNDREYLFSLIHKFAPTHICDFGCGAGETDTELGVMGYRVTGFDLSPDLVAQARRRAELDHCARNVKFLVANAEDPGLALEGFDLVLVQGVLHHVELEKCLLTLKSLLQPGGVAVIQEPIAFSPTLQRLRDKTSVEKDISPNERQLNEADIAVLEKHLQVIERRHFRVFARLERLFPERRGAISRLAYTTLERLDCAALTGLPFLRKYAGLMVIAARKR